MTALTTQIDRPFIWFDLDDTVWDMTGNSCIVLKELYHSDSDVRAAFGGRGLAEWMDVYHAVTKSCGSSTSKRR